MHTIQQYFKSYDFSRGVLMAFTVLLNGLILYNLNLSNLIPATAIGILLTSFCDLQGDMNRRVWSMMLSILLNTITFVIINLLYGFNILMFGYIAIASFFISYLGVFGQRANMFAFSGLMGIVLSLVRQHKGAELWEFIIFLIIGAFSYVFLSTIFHFITKKNQVNEKLIELIELTSQYIEIQWQRIQPNTEVSEDKRLNLHQQITEKQESLRNLLFTNELFGGASKTRHRQMLLLVELIDISELAKANPIKVDRLREHPNWKEELFIPFQEELHCHVQELRNMLTSFRSGKSLDKIPKNKDSFILQKEAIMQFAYEHGVEKVRSITIPLLNYHDYLEKQRAKISVAYHLIKNKNIRDKKPIILNYREKFIQSEEYSLRGFGESLRLSSPVMRHSIRLTVAMLLGYFIGWLLNVQNTYWIMLTVVVIMRPSYGLTKNRSVQRVMGTLVGVIISIGVVQLTANVYIYLVLALLSMIFAFSLINRNYFYASIAITLNVIFAFALIIPDQWDVIQYRFINTIIGGAVCAVIGYTILPYWEYKTLKGTMLDTIKSNMDYMIAINQLYKDPSSDLDYRLHRKKAFAVSGELNAAFQGFTQDPKSKQKNVSLYYDWLIINQNYLASLANLGSYIQNHHSADIKGGFDHAMNYLQIKLKQILNILNSNENVEPKEEPLQLIEEYWSKLETKRSNQLAQGVLELEEDLRLEMQEVKHIKEELNLLDELVDKLMDISLKLSPKPIN